MCAYGSSLWPAISAVSVLYLTHAYTCVYVYKCVCVFSTTHAILLCRAHTFIDGSKKGYLFNIEHSPRSPEYFDVWLNSMSKQIEFQVCKIMCMLCGRGTNSPSIHISCISLSTSVYDSKNIEEAVLVDTGVKMCVCFFSTPISFFRACVDADDVKFYNTIRIDSEGGAARGERLEAVQIGSQSQQAVSQPFYSI